MKNTIKLIGIIALLAIVGFGMAACDNGTTSGTTDVAKGTFTLTNIPAEYIGSYACFSLQGNGTLIFGSDRVEIEGQNIILHFTKVTGSTVTIPLWTFPDPGSLVAAGYSGNDSYNSGTNLIGVLITDRAQHTLDSNPIPRSRDWEFESITFSQGSAELSVNDAGE